MKKTPLVAPPLRPLKEVLKEIEADSEEGKKHFNIWLKYLAKEKSLKKGIQEEEARTLITKEEVIKRIKKALSSYPKAKVVSLKGVVVAAPDYETATHWGSFYFSRFGEKAYASGLPTYILKGDEDVPAKFHSMIREGINASFVCGIGHGDWYVFTGQNGIPLLLIGDLETKLTSQNRIFHLLSCVVGKELGRKMVEDYKAKAFFGYDETYTFIIDEAAYPDSLASYFFDSDGAIDEELLVGKTCGEALYACIDAYEEAISQAPEICRPYLQFDFDHLVFYGDGDATIDFVPPPPETPPKKLKLGPLCTARIYLQKKVTSGWRKISTIPSRVKEGILVALHDIKETYLHGFRTLKEGILEGLGDIKGTYLSLFRGIKDAFKETGRDIKRTYWGIPRGIKNFFKKIWTAL